MEPKVTKMALIKKFFSAIKGHDKFAKTIDYFLEHHVDNEVSTQANGQNA